MIYLEINKAGTAGMTGNVGRDRTLIRTASGRFIGYNGTYNVIKSSISLVKLEKLVFVIAQSTLNFLYESQYCFFLKTAADDLDADGESVHIVSIVMPLSAAGNTVELANSEVLGQLILLPIDVG